MCVHSHTHTHTHACNDKEKENFLQLNECVWTIEFRKKKKTNANFLFKCILSYEVFDVTQLHVEQKFISKIKSKAFEMCFLTVYLNQFLSFFEFKIIFNYRFKIVFGKIEYNNA